MENENLPLVTVICTSYNHEKFIKDCLDGFVMQQTNFAFEVIVHDDASTDSTQQIVKEYESKYPHLFNNIYQTENQYSKGNNDVGKIVFGLAKSKYIAICEGDDYWIDPLKLQKQVDFLESNTSFGLVFTDADLFYQKRQEFIKSYDKTFKRKIPTGDVLKILIEGNPYKTCTSLFRNELINDIFKINVLNRKAYGDKSIWMHIASKSKVGYIAESTSVYRVLESSASHFNKLSEVISFYKEAYSDSIEKSEFYKIPIDKNKLKRDFNKIIINYCLEHNNYKELISFYKNSDLIFYLLIKENLIRPLFKKFNKN